MSNANNDLTPDFVADQIRHIDETIAAHRAQILLRPKGVVVCSKDSSGLVFSRNERVRGKLVLRPHGASLEGAHRFATLTEARRWAGDEFRALSVEDWHRDRVESLTEARGYFAACCPEGA